MRERRHERLREKQTDRQTDRQREGEGERGWVWGLEGYSRSKRRSV